MFVTILFLEIKNTWTIFIPNMMLGSAGAQGPGFKVGASSRPTALGPEPSWLKLITIKRG